ncbi:hypothetical protein [Nocardioides jiangxiensis]|uniref:Excreted virulence factor EspC, type VII ESX diderm n=1 Tax=Nocardioides jiangxiensis TaxID=3064524 RepID=A0ABT9AWN3_9ACTN|nr:hypothetical protein [Nocardioides sp. WY-20]MDO7866870.1 hypothetical protein [Nocardioides sp. WY-20]
MSDDFAVATTALTTHAASIRSVREAVACLAAPPLPDAGESTGLLATTVAGILASVDEAGAELTALGAALLDAAREYAAADAAVAGALGSWSAP